MAAREAEDALQRECHALVVQSHGRWGGMPAKHFDWHGDLRRGKNRIYGGLLRWIDTMIERHEALETILQIPAWITAYITDRYADARRAFRQHRAFTVWHDQTIPTNDCSEDLTDG